MTTANLYKKHKSGKISREKFLYEVRRDDNLPWITNVTSYTDAIKILKNKGIINEIHTSAQEKASKGYTPDGTSLKLKEVVIASEMTTQEASGHAERFAKYMSDKEGKTFTVTGGSVDGPSFDLDLDGKKYEGGSYIISIAGEILNVSLPEHPVYANTKMLEAKKDEKSNVKDNLGNKEAGTTKPKGITIMPDKGVTGSEKTIKEGLFNEEGGNIKIEKQSDGKYYWTFTSKSGKTNKSYDGFDTSSEAQKDFMYRSKYLKEDTEDELMDSILDILVKENILTQDDIDKLLNLGSMKEGLEISDLKKGDTVEYEGNKYKIGDFDTAGGANLVYLNTMDGKPAEDSKGRYKKVHKSRVKKINEGLEEFNGEEGVVQHVNSIGNDRYEIADWYDSDSTVCSYENGRELNENDAITEVSLPDNIKAFAKRRGATSLVNKIAGWAEKAGRKIGGGVAIGKNYDTLVLDLGYQDGAIHINLNSEEVTLHGEPVTDAKSFASVLNGMSNSDNIIFSINDEKLDDILHANHRRELEYMNISGDVYYILPTKEFDRFIDYADSSGYDVDYENSEDSVINIKEASGGSMAEDLSTAKEKELSKLFDKKPEDLKKKYQDQQKNPNASIFSVKKESTVKEHHDDPNFPKIKGVYALLDGIALDWGKGDLYFEVEDAIIGFYNEETKQFNPGGIAAVKQILHDWDVLEQYDHLLGDISIDKSLNTEVDLGVSFDKLKGSIKAEDGVKTVTLKDFYFIHDAGKYSADLKVDFSYMYEPSNDVDAFGEFDQQIKSVTIVKLSIYNPITKKLEPVNSIGAMEHLTDVIKSNNDIMNRIENDVTDTLDLNEAAEPKVVDFTELLKGAELEMSKMDCISDENYIKATKKAQKALEKNSDAYRNLSIANWTEITKEDEKQELQSVKKDNFVDTENKMKKVPTIKESTVIVDLISYLKKKDLINEDSHYNYKVGSSVNTPDGEGVVTEISGGTLTIKMESGNKQDYQLNIIDKANTREGQMYFKDAKVDQDKYTLDKDGENKIIRVAIKDGEVFSIGDDVTTKDGEAIKITSFVEEQSKIKAVYNTGMFFSSIDIEGLLPTVAKPSRLGVDEMKDLIDKNKDKSAVLEKLKTYIKSKLNKEALTAKTGDGVHDAEVLKKISKIPNSQTKAELTTAFKAGKSIDI